MIATYSNGVPRETDLSAFRGGSSYTSTHRFHVERGNLLMTYLNGVSRETEFHRVSLHALTSETVLVPRGTPQLAHGVSGRRST